MKKYNWTNRPWGRYKTLMEALDYKFKILEIYPGKRFSLQYHNLREEYWAILQGKCKFTKGKKKYKLNKNSKWIVFIGKKEIHRAENIGKEVVRILELQRGKCSEKDIVRIEDDFGRIKK